MANLILILGKTSSGKSRSLINLDPLTTYIINCLDKDLPFRTGRKRFNRENKNIKYTKDYKEVIKILKALPKTKEETKTIIIDDARHIMESEYLERATEVGYTKFTQLGQHMIEVLETAKAMPNDINVFIMLHTDDVTNEQKIVEFKPKLVGKLVEDHFNPIEIVTIALFTYVKHSQDKCEYYFVTNKIVLNGIEYSAKSPEGMFELKIPNDLVIVEEAIKEYYS